MQHKYHFPPMNLYIHLKAPSPSVDIMLAMISWLLEIYLNTEFLQYTFVHTIIDYNNVYVI